MVRELVRLPSTDMLCRSDADDARICPLGPHGTIWDPGGRKAAAASCRLGGPRGPGPGHPGTGVRGIPGPSGAGARAGPPAFSHPPPPSFTVRNISSAHVTFSSCLSFTPTTVKRTSSSRKYSLIASHPSRTLWNDSSSNPQAPCFFVCATAFALALATSAFFFFSAAFAASAASLSAIALASRSGVDRGWRASGKIA